MHLDIAGTAWLDESKPFLAKGPSGVPLRTLVRLARHGLAELLPVRVYGDDPFEPKPGPGGLRHAIGALGLAGQPGEIAYVGDALDDMRMALAAGARGVGIRSDLATDGELRAAGASEVADSVAAWVDVLLG